MIARAPGKLVLSGAYSVLEGATAIVAAVDRYVIADTSRPAERQTDEVLAAIRAGAMKRAVWFDASALRFTLPDGGDVKLGIGSSAAIVAASMAAAWADEDRTLDNRVLFSATLSAHRTAQKGGSGIDVAASVFGGVLACTLGGEAGLVVKPHELPSGVHIHVFATHVAASTPELLRLVRGFSATSPDRYRSLMDRAKAGAHAALAAEDVPSLLCALTEQSAALRTLGQECSAPIFTPDVDALVEVATAEQAVFYPSGAGGGDAALFVGGAPPSPEFLAQAQSRGRFHIPMIVGAPGVHLVSTTSPSAAPLLGV
ncbi:MAG: hypothetical protein IPK82_25765 [Polyangiaceae bacterium]|nr:hypothetical protein [Polyangiaceae bacterium]